MTLYALKIKRDTISHFIDMDRAGLYVEFFEFETTILKDWPYSGNNLDNAFITSSKELITILAQRLKGSTLVVEIEEIQADIFTKSDKTSNIQYRRLDAEL